MRKLLIMAFVIAAATVAGKSYALVVPQDDSSVEYFYVFGPKGDPLTGAEDHMQELHIDIPADAQDVVEISVYDPDTGGYHDKRGGVTSPWDTRTRITLSGKRGVQLKKQFEEGEYDSEFYNFEPLSKTDGVKRGDFYRFTLKIVANKGDDANLFKVKVSPENASISSPNLTFRLLPEEGAVMRFYPLIPEGTTRIVVENYDIDEDGGSSLLRDPETNEVYEINDSLSGQWSKTAITLSSAKKRFLDYVITKATQVDAHAGLRISDADGNPIPIYFRKGGLGECNEFTFDATESFDPDNQALTYNWDFGDGTTSSEPIVTHRFEDGGDYNVVLSVQDTSGLDCDTAVSSRIVHVNTPPDADFTSPQTACTGEEVTFDAGGTTDDTPDKLTYRWNFRDGTSAEGRRVTKTFDKGGTYNVQLLVNDNSETTCSTDSLVKAITINTNPVADAGDDIDLCLQYNQDYRINFNGSGSTDADGDMLAYRWDFGDGNSAPGPDVTHVYESRGEYVATLFVDDGSDSACSAASDTVNVKINRAPVALAGDDITTCQGVEVVFDGSSSIGEEGEDLKYEWDFGDGTRGSGANVTHTYENGGVYKAVLTVNDLQYTKCSSSSDSILVTVNSKPAAVMDVTSIAVTGDEISFDASESNDPDGDALTYAWDFGDGSDAQTGSRVTHVYNKGGSYYVQLSVADNKGTDCSNDAAAAYVIINTPPSAVVKAVKSACTEEVVSFDASGSSDLDGDELTYTWDFGDGTTEQGGSSVTHVYNKGGNYSVRLVVDDNKGTVRSTDVATVTVSINTHPSAVLKAVNVACTGDSISFDASGSSDVDGDSLTYAWDFGDGTEVKRGSSVTHVYDKGGNYSARLVVDDNKGTKCSKEMAGINVRINTPPVADAGPNLVCCINVESVFDASSSYDADGDSLSYSWDFGDGSTGVGVSVKHVYTEIGTFVVTLTVSDNSGTMCDTATDSFTAVVNAKPTSIIKIR